MRDVELAREPWLRGIGIYVREWDADSRTISVLSPQGVWTSITEGEQYEPTLRLDDDAARSLMYELSKMYGGGDDTRQLRKDYDAERGRVDRLMATVSEIAASRGRT